MAKKAHILLYFPMVLMLVAMTNPPLKTAIKIIDWQETASAACIKKPAYPINRYTLDSIEKSSHNLVFHLKSTFAFNAGYKAYPIWTIL